MKEIILYDAESCSVVEKHMRTEFVMLGDPLWRVVLRCKKGGGEPVSFDQPLFEYNKSDAFEFSSSASGDFRIDVCFDRTPNKKLATLNANSEKVAIGDSLDFKIEITEKACADLPRPGSEEYWEVRKS